MLRTRKADYTGENTTVDDEYPRESEWVFKTTCQGDACTLAMRRELGSGAFKNVTLQADPEREDVYVADTTKECKLSDNSRGVVSWRSSLQQ